MSKSLHVDSSADACNAACIFVDCQRPYLECPSGRACKATGPCTAMADNVWAFPSLSRKRARPKWQQFHFCQATQVCCRPGNSKTIVCSPRTASKGLQNTLQGLSVLPTKIRPSVPLQDLSAPLVDLCRRELLVRGRIVPVRAPARPAPLLLAETH